MMYAYSVSTKRLLVVAVVALAVVMSGQRAQAQFVQSHQKISSTQGGGPPLGNGDRFGRSATSLGDLDSDGIDDLAVGAWRDDDGGTDRGAVWILFLNADGTVKSDQTQKISDTEGGFKGILDEVDLFGISVAALGDLDGDGPSVLALAVGAGPEDDGGNGRGAVWIHCLTPDGTVNYHQKISDTEGGFTGILDDLDGFGVLTTSLGDHDGDGVVDLAVGAWRDDDGGTPPNADRGAVWILFLNTDGTVNHHQKISSTAGGGPPLGNFDNFGNSVISLGDHDGDGVGDLAVGAIGDDDGGSARGAVWVLFLDGVPAPGKCPADLNGDGSVGILDLLALLAAWGSNPGGPPDFDGDGTVGILDLLTLLANWGPCA